MLGVGNGCPMFEQDLVATSLAKVHDGEWNGFFQITWFQIRPYTLPRSQHCSYDLRKNEINSCVYIEMLLWILESRDTMPWNMDFKHGNLWANHQKFSFPLIRDLQQPPHHVVGFYLRFFTRPLLTCLPTVEDRTFCNPAEIWWATSLGWFIEIAHLSIAPSVLCNNRVQQIQPQKLCSWSGL